MKKDIFIFLIGVAIGYGLIQGLAFLSSNYLWAIFYH